MVKKGAKKTAVKQVPQESQTVQFLERHLIWVVLFALFVGALVGFYASLFFLESDWKPAAAYQDEHDHDLDDHTTADHSHGEHVHTQIAVPQDVAVPSVSLDVFEDAKGGFNLRITTENFELSPASVNADNVWGEGHAHLYLDGVKITRLYGEWYYLDALEKGSHKIMVTLNTNDHQELVYGGQVISAMQTVIVG